MSEQFPRGLRAFIERCLTSAVHVEVLLLLHRQRDHGWTPDAVGRALRVEPDQARAAMEHLNGRGLLVSDHDGYRLSPGSTHDRAMVDSWPTSIRTTASR